MIVEASTVKWIGSPDPSVSSLFDILLKYMTSSNTQPGYCFQSPFYKEGSWNLALCVRPPTGSLNGIIRGAFGGYGGNLSEGFKTVGVLEAGSSVDLAAMFDKIHLSALRSSHPLVVPLHLFEEHVKQTSKSFMRISKKLADVEQAIDVSLNSDPSFQKLKTNDNTSLEGVIEQRPYGRWSKTVYECSTELHDLERRRDFEWRFEKFLADDRSTVKAGHSGLKEMMDWLAVIKASSSTRDFDIRSLPRRIEALTSLVRECSAPSTPHVKRRGRSTYGILTDWLTD
jgi:hypothetical protein